MIDPSGTAIDFIMASWEHRNVVKTSFLDPSFVKNLESALRFGSALLVQDADAMDPIINPLLNGDLSRVGGRVLVNVGNQEVAFDSHSRSHSTRHDSRLTSRQRFLSFS